MPTDVYESCLPPMESFRVLQYSGFGSDKCLDNIQEDDRQPDLKEAVLIPAVSGMAAGRGQQKIRQHIVKFADT